MHKLQEGEHAVVEKQGVVGISTSIQHVCPQHVYVPPTWCITTVPNITISPNALSTMPLQRNS